MLVNSLRLKIYYQLVELQLKRNIFLEKFLKFGVNKKDENILVEFIKFVKVNFFERDCDIILSKCCFDDNVINELQKFLKK